MMDRKSFHKVFELNSLGDRELDEFLAEEKLNLESVCNSRDYKSCTGFIKWFMCLFSYKLVSSAKKGQREGRKTGEKCVQLSVSVQTRGGLGEIRESLPVRQNTQAGMSHIGHLVHPQVVYNVSVEDATRPIGWKSAF